MAEISAEAPLAETFDVSVTRRAASGAAAAAHRLERALAQVHLGIEEVYEWAQEHILPHLVAEQSPLMIVVIGRRLLHADTRRAPTLWLTTALPRWRAGGDAGRTAGVRAARAVLPEVSQTTSGRSTQPHCARGGPRPGDRLTTSDQQNRPTTTTQGRAAPGTTPPPTKSAMHRRLRHSRRSHSASRGARSRSGSTQ